MFVQHLYVVIDLIPQPQPQSPQPQLLSPQSSCPQLQLLSPHHNNDRTTTWTSTIQCLHTITLKRKMPLTFILHTHNYYPKMILFLIPNKHSLTNKTIIHHNILRHPHNNHKHKHQTKINIPSLVKIPLYDFMRKTWMILVRMRQFFDHINDQSDDQSDDEGVGEPTSPLSPLLQYHQPRCPVELNLDHLPHYIDRYHFI